MFKVFKKPITVILFLFFFLNLLVLINTPKFIPFLGFFPYIEFALKYNLPSFLTPLAYFDGVHYLSIAENGYQQFQQAFFPLYSTIINALGNLFNQNYFIAALVISNLSLIASIFVLQKLFKIYFPKFKKSNLIWFFLFFLFFPTSFYFSAVYTESLFLLLFLLSLYFWYQKKYFLASIFGSLTSLTRLIGIFLFIPFLVSFIFSKKKNKSQLFFAFTPLIGLLIYSIYLYITTGDPLFFFNAQPAFGANRSTDIILFPQVIYRYLKIFFIAQPDFKYFIAVFEFITFSFFALILLLQLVNIYKNKKNLNTALLGLNLFSFVNLFLPPLTGTFSSIPRYSIMSLSVFIFLSQLKKLYLKIILFVIFLILHILALAFFSQGYFVS